MANHTPGPWQVGDEGPAIITIEATDGRAACVLAEMSPSGDLDSEDFANARLIAAAPELLEACKAQHEAIDRLLAQIIGLDQTFLPTRSGQPWQAMIQGNAAIAKAEGK